MTPDRILRRPEVEHLTGLSRATIYRQIKANLFPRPLPLTRRLVGWRESQITAWIEGRKTDGTQ